LSLRHPERSEAKSKDPVNPAFGFATEFLDYAWNDKNKPWQNLSMAALSRKRFTVIFAVTLQN
jgi:hypothetical protein